MNDNKRKAQLIILLTFVLGAAVGSLSTYLLLNRPARPANAVSGMLDEMTAKVKLDQQQRAQAEVILQDTKAQFRDVRKQMEPRFLEVRDRTRTRMKAILTPEQQVLYDQWTQEMDARHEQRKQNKPAH